MLFHSPDLLRLGAVVTIVCPVINRHMIDCTIVCPVINRYMIDCTIVCPVINRHMIDRLIKPSVP